MSNKKVYLFAGTVPDSVLDSRNQWDLEVCVSKEKNALKLALEALEDTLSGDLTPYQAAKTITAIREALAEQPAQQPHCNDCGGFDPECPLAQPAQPSKPWVGLTQQDIDIAFDDTQEGGGFNEFARAIEAKLREKNA